MRLRASARGRDCTIRLEGVCNFDPETTVLAHYRMVGYSGAGYKPPDFMAAFACSACHDAVDRRRFLDLEREHVALAHLRGVLRTQAYWFDHGFITIP
jgi:hypothetical protein